MAHEVKEICTGVDNRAFKNITPQNKQQFLQILNIIIKNLGEEDY